MEPADVIDINAAADQMLEAWKPLGIAEANGSVVRLARLDGAFEWHQHDEDEMFICWRGEFRIELEGSDSVTLRAGDAYVVPPHTHHRPVADAPAYTLVFERLETKQYGN